MDLTKTRLFSGLTGAVLGFIMSWVVFGPIEECAYLAGELYCITLIEGSPETIALITVIGFILGLIITPDIAGVFEEGDR